MSIRGHAVTLPEVGETVSRWLLTGPSIQGRQRRHEEAEPHTGVTTIHEKPGVLLLVRSQFDVNALEAIDGVGQAPSA